MGVGLIILILIIAFMGWYLYTNPELLKMSFPKNPLDNYIQNITTYNNTPSSTITQTGNVKSFGQPWQYYSCQNHESCKATFGPGVSCNLTSGICYTIIY